MPDDRLTLAQAGFDALSGERPRLDLVDRYVAGDHDGPYTPRSATAEYQLLVKRSISNWLPLLVKTPSQALAVEGYRRTDATPDDTVTSAEWQAWQANRLDGRQTAVHASALTYGQAFVSVLPSPTDPSVPAVRGISPRRMWAYYADAATDALPEWAVEVADVTVQTGVETKAWLYDAQGVTVLSVNGKAGPVVLGYTPHSLGVCPVVRFAPDLDLEGRVRGVVEPMIPIQDRINQTVFDLLVAQTFGSFKVRTIAGLAPEFERDADGNALLDPTTGKPKVIPIQADASRFLVAPDADTKFGQLDETNLAGFLSSIEASVRHLAATSQTPPHYLLGAMVNLSAEALAAAESALTRSVDQYKHVFGEAWELVLSLCAQVAGAAPDDHGQVVWRDAESRSLSATVDALGKAVQMLNVPARAMWSRIPGATATDVEEWSQMAAEDDPVNALADSLAKVGTPAAGAALAA